MEEEGPKKEGSAKKGKLSKAEKERIKREEAEKKAQEEEEARLEALKEAKAQKQREKVEAIERKKLENEEREIRKVEVIELLDQISDNQRALDETIEEEKKLKKWERFMQCDGSPNPAIPSEINTYVNIRFQAESEDDIESVLKNSALDLKLIDELDALLKDSPSQVEKDNYENTKTDIQELIQRNLDDAAHQILVDSSLLQDTDTGNLQYCKKDDIVCICLWGNLSKNPRIKTFEFTEPGFTFDIPKSLTLQEIAFRIQFTKYDHYSPSCQTYFAREKSKMDIKIEVPSLEAEPEVAVEVEKADEEKEKEGQSEAGDEKEPSLDIDAALKEAEEDEEEKKEEEEEEVKVVEEEEQPEEDDIIDPQSPEPPMWEDFDEPDDILDLRSTATAGGIFHYDLLQLPPQPKQVKGWTMTRLMNPPELVYVEYASESRESSSARSEHKDGEEEATKKKKVPTATLR